MIGIDRRGMGKALVVWAAGFLVGGKNKLQQKTEKSNKEEILEMLRAEYKEMGSCSCLSPVSISPIIGLGEYSQGYLNGFHWAMWLIEEEIRKEKNAS